MSRSVAVRPFLLAALGAALVLASPAVAQASTRAPAKVVAHRAVLAGHHAVPDAFSEWVYDGYTYPDTAQGLAACDAKGQSLIKPPVEAYKCILNNPNQNVYNLWVFIHLG